MRLALLGPADGDVSALARGAASALDKLEADRVVYLGIDDAMDQVVAGWAALLGASLPLATRAAALLDADATTIHAELEREHARRRLGRLSSLAGPKARAIELMQERLILLVDDKAILDEEDLIPASVIVFGRGEPTLRRVGSRVFICPGMPAKRTQGLLLLDEGDALSGLIAVQCDLDGEQVSREVLDTGKSVKLRVQGAI